MKLLTKGCPINCTLSAPGAAVPFGTATPKKVSEKSLPVLVDTEPPTLVTICTSSLNPAAAAQMSGGAPGGPCNPKGSWTNASKLVKVDGRAALHEGSFFSCVFGGMMKFEPSSSKVEVAR